MPRQPTTWLHVSGYRFLLRRIECALLRRDVRTVSEPLRAHTASLALGCLLAAIALAGSGLVALLQPRVALDHAQIVMDQDSGALYVRVGDTWHPVLNLASARLIAATDANPQRVRGSDLSRTKRGPLLGIPGAPPLLGRPLPGDGSAWTICDTGSAAATTVVVGPIEGSGIARLGDGQTVLVAAGSGSPAYLLYHGKRAVVDLADPAVLRALRLQGRAPRPVSRALLNAVPEAPPIRAPRIRGAGGHGPAGVPGFPVGSVLRITRGDGDEYYVVLGAGVQRIGQVAADLLRFSDSQGTANFTVVAPDVLRAASIVDTLPVSAFPDRAPTPLDGDETTGTTLCVGWAPAPSGGAEIAVFAGGGLPVPAGQAPVTLAQADGRGPALDAVYLPPGRSAYVRSGTLTGGAAQVGTRYLVTDTGVRFAIHDDDAAHRLGLPTAANPAPWPMLAELPCGPELSREQASIARDTVSAGTP
ncbi:type VII secretion protein EccB [Mycobacterium lacus]|uniref:ESX-4 secretion system ATPase EccB4 n=1 Tax=Mycobacterium lacus TaxID=169765 RepID=A0A1X1YUM2_9MYCO|nr:type VII secretion protein EccB [Mycobacterium lacus]MCV7124389.1 type VII secretion protein EccB [Mycobacterium lacus]ORW14817.1 type VII secretion protein EccB [Mycobacterium lacus]BBX98103.1 ESX-4 secretion system ATPase EccB4 [Mycobacterium lacus]